MVCGKKSLPSGRLLNLGLALGAARGVELGRLPEQQEPDDEQDRDGAHARVGHARQLGHGADQHGAHEGSALSADVVDAEVFPGLLRRNDAGEVGAGERLDRALEHTHHHGEEPELPLPVELDGEQRDGRVGRDARS